ncbi:hypothetical protein [Rhizobium leguminosarum]|uniref:hypothetical protein n=1 Tax=Rhizobium leguminosarum TaxID=384 RepID=UPI001FD9CD82|nr:hypothetical protein [Rhizobium leguminosarum]
MTPLEVLLKAMREHYDKQEWDAAASIAKDAAPYMHAKLASVQHTGKDGGAIKVDLKSLNSDELEKLEALFGNLAGGAGSYAEDDPGGEGEA